MDADRLDPAIIAGQVASKAGDPNHHPDYYRRPHCEECGRLLTPHREGKAIVAYLCIEHGPIHHSGIVWVWHPEPEE